MKTKLNHFALLLITIFLVACDKENNPENRYKDYSTVTKVNLPVKVNTGLTYYMDINDKYMYEITKEPAHATGSDIMMIKTNPPQIIYTYGAKEGFKGKDYVELTMSIDSDAAFLGSSSTKHLICLDIDVREDVEETNIVERNVIINHSNSYNYVLAFAFLSPMFEITSPASHAARCEIVSIEEYPHGVYFHYTPQKGYKGKDYVEVVQYEYDSEEDRLPVLVTHRFTIEVR